MSRVLGLVLLAWAVAGCGGSASDDSSGSPTPSSQSPSPSVRPSSSGAVDAATDLTDFVCEPDRDGAWNASGVITNSTSRRADYRVTVVVSEGPGRSVPGKRRTLTDIAPGAPEPFELKALPATDETDPTCQVQVLRLH